MAVFRTCSAGLWSGAYGGGWIGVMRSSSRPGSWRAVNAFAWWDRALSGTTAVLPASVSCWSGSGARVVCSVFRFCSVGCGVTFLLVGEGVGEGLGRLLPVYGRSGALSFRGLHAAGLGLVLGAGLSLAVWAFRPWSNRALTWVVAQAMRRVVAFSLRCSSNGSGGSGLGPHGRGSSRWEGSDWCSASDRVFTTSRIAGASRNPARAPVREGGRARMVSGSCFRARAGFAAFWFPACPAGTRRILVARQSAGHSCTVLSVRSTVSAMMPVSTPREACRTASAFIRTST